MELGDVAGPLVVAPTGLCFDGTASPTQMAFGAQLCISEPKARLTKPGLFLSLDGHTASSRWAQIFQHVFLHLVLYVSGEFPLPPAAGSAHAADGVTWPWGRSQDTVTQVLVTIPAATAADALRCQGRDGQLQRGYGLCQRNIYLNTGFISFP